MLHYLISWDRPTDRLFDITIRFTAPADNPRLVLPAWRPGRYLIQNYAANVREWTAGEHRIWKDGKSSWRVEASAGDALTVRYRYYAGVLDAGSSFLDTDEAYFNGTNLFMLVEGLREREHMLTITAPAEWSIETQLPRTAGGPAGRTFRARDYDHLIDSPTIAAASLTRFTFTEAGARVFLVFHGADGLDVEQYVEPTRALVRAQAAIFGGLPFTEYRFLFHVRDRWHGVEHEDSCSIVLKRHELIGAGPGDPGYDHTLSIISHELFHVWNVKRIVPARFTPYDYWQESPTRLLWVMEGMTSYFGALALLRSGVWSVDRYLRHLAQEIQTLEGLPARAHLSLAQASFDGWLADPALMHDHPNAFFSFYNKGEVVSALLDLVIRQASDGSRSLEDVMRLLWQEYGLTGRGLEEDGFERIVARIADVGDFFARYVEGTEPLPYQELFATAGVAFASGAHAAEAPFLGVRLRPGQSPLTIESVIRGAAGMDAGLLPGDELIALDGVRLANEAVLDSAVAALPVDPPASRELLIGRAGAMRSLSLYGRPDPRPKVAMSLTSDTEIGRGWLRRKE
jgi:predicted metalloprotease with PDZ domain